MEAHYLSEERVRHRGSYVWMPDGDEMAHFENLSTTVKITDFMCTLGNPSMKSIAISAHTTDGTSRGCRTPAAWSSSILFYWHIAQAQTKSWTIMCALGMKKLAWM
jgi:hypothetical protein